jgi:hypothetical protein
MQDLQVDAFCSFSLKRTTWLALLQPLLNFRVNVDDLSYKGLQCLAVSYTQLKDDNVGVNFFAPNIISREIWVSWEVINIVGLRCNVRIFFQKLFSNGVLLNYVSAILTWYLLVASFLCVETLSLALTSHIFNPCPNAILAEPSTAALSDTLCLALPIVPASDKFPCLYHI